MIGLTVRIILSTIMLIIGTCAFTKIVSAIRSNLIGAHKAHIAYVILRIINWMRITFTILFAIEFIVIAFEIIWIWL